LGFAIRKLQRSHGLMDALGETEAVVIGQDYGAYAAYMAAAFSPSRIRKLVTIAIPHPIAFARHQDQPLAPHFAEFAQFAEKTVPEVQANDFHRLEELLAEWSPNAHVSPEELEPVKNAFTAPGSLNAALGYYRAVARTILPKESFQTLAMPALTFNGSQDKAGSQVAFVDQHLAYTRRGSLRPS
jgi:pimeloyl-ACP methyl ester carboxylesterase